MSYLLKEKRDKDSSPLRETKILPPYCCMKERHGQGTWIHVSSSWTFYKEKTCPPLISFSYHNHQHLCIKRQKASSVTLHSPVFPSKNILSLKEISIALLAQDVKSVTPISWNYLLERLRGCRANPRHWCCPHCLQSPPDGISPAPLKRESAGAWQQNMGH